MLSDIRKLIIPEGWACIGYQIPKKGQGFVSASTGFFVVADMDFNDQSTSVRLCFRKVESVDTELEDARKLIGTWVKHKRRNYLFKVEGVRREQSTSKNYPILINGNCHEHYLFDVTPFPLPIWRCCETDKPEKSCSVITRHKLEHSFKKLGMDYVAGKGWESIYSGREADYEWLDEGGAE